jgi:glutamate carboxypeptidase
MIQIDDVRAREAALLDSVRDLVTRESPSLDKEAVDHLVGYIRERCRRLDGQIEEHPQPAHGDLTVVRWPGATADDRPILVLTHVDTVWPLGTIERLPFAVKDGRATGPGVFDMKSSVAMMLEALSMIQERGLAHRPITWLINTEEEVGSPASRPLIEQLARESEVVLVLEPPVPPHGSLKTARKGVGNFHMEIHGRAAHAGADPKQGISATQELANQIQYLHGLTDFELGTTVNVGVVSGGTRSNVIAAEARADIDLRVTTMAEAERVVDAIVNTRPRLPGARVEVRGGLNRPPMERTERVIEAFQRVQALGRELGLELTEASTGGASDGNFTAALGATTIDGLGCPGDGGHAEHEHILIDGLIERTALLAALLTRL